VPPNDRPSDPKPGGLGGRAAALAELDALIRPAGRAWLAMIEAAARGEGVARNGHTQLEACTRVFGFVLAEAPVEIVSDTDAAKGGLRVVRAEDVTSELKRRLGGGSK